MEAKQGQGTTQFTAGPCYEACIEMARRLHELREDIQAAPLVTCDRTHRDREADAVRERLRVLESYVRAALASARGEPAPLFRDPATGRTVYSDPPR